MSKKHKRKGQINNDRECVLYVDGMHCSSCEILIEKKLLKKEGIESVEASLEKGKVTMIYNGQRPDLKEINNEFKESGYEFSEKKFKKEKDAPLFSLKGDNLRINSEKLGNLFNGLIIFAIVAFGFSMLSKSPIVSQISEPAGTSYVGGFLYGLVAGLSSCAALVGGLLLSMTKQWNELYIDEKSGLKKAMPFVLFNAGRIISFFILGGLLGLLGGVFKVGENTAAWLTIVVSIVMVLLALQMLEVKWAQKFKFSLPKSATGFVANENNFKGKLMPFVVGFLTFFLPCAFTLSAQTISLGSGDFLKGGLFLLSFALGTLPILALISFTSVKLTSNPKVTAKFNYIAGIIVLVFAIFNLNNQLNVLDLPSLNDINISGIFSSGGKDPGTLAVMEGEKQVLKMEVTSTRYIPNYLKVKAGIPVKWQIEANGPLGCAGTLQSKFLDEIVFINQGITEFEFIPPALGKYKFSCSMGMVVGTLEVIE